MDIYFPDTDATDSGLLDVGDGQQVYWETCGNPNGRPTVFVHGGPGSGCSVGQRRLFDPETRMGVLFDQRGCGRSRPLVDDPMVPLEHNTTQHLIADMELIRALLGIETWDVVGFSWGTTLGLAYAQAHPERVSGLILGLVATSCEREVDWITNGVGRLFPAEFDAFNRFVPDAYRRDRIVDSYADMLNCDDEQLRFDAALAWCRWEDAHISLGPDANPDLQSADPDFRYRFARLVTHYWRNNGFFPGDTLIEGASTLNGIPGHLIHGRFDVSSAMETPWRIHQNWTSSTLTILDDAGHGSQQSFPVAVIDALADLARITSF